MVNSALRGRNGDGESNCESKGAVGQHACRRPESRAPGRYPNCGLHLGVWAAATSPGERFVQRTGGAICHRKAESVVARSSHFNIEGGRFVADRAGLGSEEFDQDARRAKVVKTDYHPNFNGTLHACSLGDEFRGGVTMLVMADDNAKLVRAN